MSGGSDRVSIFFPSRRAGFYLTVIAAFLSLIVAVIYGIGFCESKYFTVLVIVLPALATVAYIPFALFRQTEQFAPVVVGVLNFIAFLVFIRKTYQYLFDVFYNGDFAGFSFGFVAFLISFVLMLASIVLSNIAIYLRQAEYNMESKGEVS